MQRTSPDRDQKWTFEQNLATGFGALLASSLLTLVGVEGSPRVAAGLSFGALLCVVPNLGSSSPVGVILLSLLCTVRLSFFFLLPLWQQIPTTAAIRWVANGQNQSTPDTFYQGGLDALSGCSFFTT